MPTKCDEARPVCSNCSKRSITCIYAPTSTAAPTSQTAEPASDPRRLSPPSSTPIAAHDNPPALDETDSHADSDEALFSSESSARRKLELELMYTFTTSTAISLPTSASLAVWRTEGPRIALSHEPLLAAIFSLAALHLSKQRPSDPLYPTARRWYLRRAIHLHRSTLHTLAEHNFERIYLATSLICHATFLGIGEDEPDPADADGAFLLPMLWFRMSAGLSRVWESCLPWIWHSEILVAAARATEHLIQRDLVVNVQNRGVFPELLEWRRQEEAMTGEEAHAYDDSACYIGKAFADAKSGEESQTMCVRRLQVFPPWSKQVFFQLVDERRPRALVMLAYLYAFVVALDVDEWWYESLSMALEKQVRLICERIPPAWKDMMRLPMHLVNREWRIADAV